MSKFTLKLVTPYGVGYEGEVEEASVPTPDGQITILANHMPLITMVSPGEIKLKTTGKDTYLATEGGIAYVAKDFLKILADTADSAESLDEAKIEEAKNRAQRMMADAVDEAEFANVQALLEKQLAKLSFIKRRKRKS